MKTTLAAIMLFCFAFLLAAGEGKPVFREPFTLKLDIDGKSYYEQKISEKIPYVHKGNVYIFVGESFGINVKLDKDGISAISYQKDAKKADVFFDFTQVEKEDGKNIMMLTITNNLKKTLCLDALMTRPQKEGVFKTSILPVLPKLQNFEMWPHPILQLVLKNFRFKSETTKKQN